MLDWVSALMTKVDPMSKNRGELNTTEMSLGLLEIGFGCISNRISDFEKKPTISM